MRDDVSGPQVMRMQATAGGREVHTDMPWWQWEEIREEVRQPRISVLMRTLRDRLSDVGIRTGVEFTVIEDPEPDLEDTPDPAIRDDNTGEGGPHCST